MSLLYMVKESEKMTLTRIAPEHKQMVTAICSSKLFQCLFSSEIDHPFPVGGPLLVMYSDFRHFINGSFLFIGYHCMHLFQGRICIQLLTVSPFPFDWVCSHFNTWTDPAVVWKDLQ